MNLLLALAIGIVGAAGAWLLLSRDGVRVVLGLSMLGGAVNLLILATGRPLRLPPAIVPAGAAALAEAADPVPQALVLTAIVIGFALSCLALLLLLQLARRTGDLDTDALRAAEPPSGPDGAAP
jgi:multisubunit Na+/H+ antiporter MnhC subunit